MKKKKIKLMCIVPIGDDIKKLRFKAGKRYDVVINHPVMLSVIDEFGYKMNFSRREEDMNLLYVWDYFYDEDKELLDSAIEKLY